jgi:hypothetical protein
MTLIRYHPEGARLDQHGLTDTEYEAVIPPDTQDVEIENWLQQVDLWHRRLEPQFPDIDPHDLRMILRSLFQPPSVKRRWLLRKTEDGRYVL